MKILHITDHLPGYHNSWGGAEQVAYRFIKFEAEQSKDDKIVVCTVKPVKTIVEDFLHLRIRVLEDLFPGKVQVYITGLKNRVFSFDPVSFFHLLWVLFQQKPDVIHFHKFNIISFSGVLAAKILGVKTVLGIYDYWYLCPGGMLIDGKRNFCRKFHGDWCRDCDAVTDFRFLLPIIAPMRRKIFDYFLNRIDGYAVLSNSLGKLLVEYGIPKNKIFLVRQIFDIKIKSPHFAEASRGKQESPLRRGFAGQAKAQNSRKDILFIGWIDPRKGPDIAIKSIIPLLKEFPLLKLFMIGEGLDKKYRKNIEDLIKSFGLSKNVVMVGKISHEETVKYLKKCAVILLPEQWENMSPVVLIEAMNYGIPVVASNIGGIPEFIKDGETGYLVNRLLPEEFSKKVRSILKNPVKSLVMSKKAQNSILMICSKDQIYKSLRKLYRQLLI